MLGFFDHDILNIKTMIVNQRWAFGGLGSDTSIRLRPPGAIRRSSATRMLATSTCFADAAARICSGARI
jgi:hypothetical protein